MGTIVQYHIGTKTDHKVVRTVPFAQELTTDFGDVRDFFIGHPV